MLKSSNVLQCCSDAEDILGNYNALEHYGYVMVSTLEHWRCLDGDFQ